MEADGDVVELDQPIGEASETRDQRDAKRMQRRAEYKPAYSLAAGASVGDAQAQLLYAKPYRNKQPGDTIDSNCAQLWRMREETVYDGAFQLFSDFTNCGYPCGGVLITYGPASTNKGQVQYELRCEITPAFQGLPIVQEVSTCGRLLLHRPSSNLQEGADMKYLCRPVRGSWPSCRLLCKLCSVARGLTRYGVPEPVPEPGPP